jgi:hypothetical protein
VRVAGEVAVAQVLHEVPRPAPPVQVQVLGEERADDHPHAVVHVRLAEQLAHARVDDRVAGRPVAHRSKRRSASGPSSYSSDAIAGCSSSRADCGLCHSTSA